MLYIDRTLYFINVVTEHPMVCLNFLNDNPLAYAYAFTDSVLALEDERTVKVVDITLFHSLSFACLSIVLNFDVLIYVCCIRQQIIHKNTLRYTVL